MDVEALQASIQALQFRKSNLIRELEDVDLELRRQQATHACLLNEKSPIYRLPTEIITNIFLICHGYQIRRRHAKTHIQNSSICFPLVASRVSRRWRVLALHTPLLWNVIDTAVPIAPSFGQHPVQGAYRRLQIYLERSRDCFVDVSIHFLGFGGRCSLPGQLFPIPVIDLLREHSRRWRRVALISKCDIEAGFVANLRSALHGVEAPILEHISLHFGIPQEPSLSPRTRYDNILTHILTNGAPMLSFVRLAGMALSNLHPPLNAVTTLHLDGWTRHYGTHDQFRAILQSAPSLINLSLNELCIHHPRDPLLIIQPTPLPHLQSLRICGGFSSTVSFLLSLLDIPNLRHVTLMNVDTFDSGFVSTAETLQLESCAFNEHDIAHLLQSFPSLTHLSVDGVMPDIFFMLKPEGDETSNPRLAPPPWPKLHILSLHELQPSDVNMLFQMILSRLAYSQVDERPGSALRKVTLDRRSRTVLRTKQQLSALRDLVDVENLDNLEPWPPGLAYDDVHDLLE